ncbi:MAG: urea ABC transporter permease subunit UrtC [Betaproteobacteria bacterium]|jgi:urea transport system permease protein|nr:urea ABC transporter permease subunit UrtC [Rhodocyclaceae bacterium]MCA3133550.1 urea ABC transporter permease subunit UrtC [Rhodocyclaceae bacterium]MCA3141484.1 urea ABC transporter permease subunit UrtC [Rhodocyclaceae bacterium]MCA3145815.1 urea ABC transporter permease subunit UrtC [Rhodocyclaceae bacterium]MCE2897073.1 urea ABC transporter permease subunit UrtC [Betaproteobacteria bacterium]
MSETVSVPVASGASSRRGNWWGVASFGLLAALMLVVFPLAMDVFRLGLAAKYLCLGFCAVGIVLIWGYGGILSLGQGVFFGLGSYMMAMFLKLEAAANADSSSGTALSAFFGQEGLPDFMSWNSVEKLPWWWEPFHHVWFTVAAILVIPPLLAFVLSYANFRKRVGGVYFSIVTLALSAIMAIVIIGQQGYTGGVNGITDFKTFLGHDLDNDRSKVTMYMITAGLLLLCVAIGAFILRSRLGRVLVAIRDREDRVRFSGYDPALFKAFIFAVAALFSSIGGAMFTIQVGLASPSLVGIVPSVEMVIYAAVGGRLSLVGAVYGALIVGWAKTFFSENFVEYWPYFIGLLFVVVVMFLPTGLAGLLDRLRGRAAGGGA